MDKIKAIPIKSILIDEDIFGEFNRFDIIMRLYAVEEYYGENDFGIELYKKMQNIRIKEKKWVERANEDSWLRFKKLIDGFEKECYRYNFPVRFNFENRLINGAHRVSLAIYKQFPLISYMYSTNRKEYSTHCYYGINWFIKNGFTNAEIDLMIKKYRFLKKNIYEEIYSLIWCPGISKIKDIESQIKHYLIEPVAIKKKIISFNSDRECAEFIRWVYKEDTMSKERLEIKIRDILTATTERKIAFLKINIQFPSGISYSDYRLYPEMQSKYIVDFKKKIRQYLAEIIPSYKYDNVFHCGSSYKENLYLQKIFRNYFNIICSL